jgi:serine O-acetyltransferase
MSERDNDYFKGSNDFELSKKNIIRIIKDVRDILFPGYFNSLTGEATDANLFLKERIYTSLKLEIIKISKNNIKDFDADVIAKEFVKELPEIVKILKTDLEAAYNGDPAAEDYNEIIIAYPGFFAITVHRIAHILYQKGVPYIPRIMSEYAHSRTGIDIHPGAQIGPFFFIDHGTGTVIGETTIIGSNVKIYQNVTLGALSLGRGQLLKGTKRHPTIKDNVTIYSGASILGGNTTINNNVTIGANAIVTEDVEENSIVILKKSDLEIIKKAK